MSGMEKVYIKKLHRGEFNKTHTQIYVCMYAYRYTYMYNIHIYISWDIPHL